MYSAPRKLELGDVDMGLLGEGESSPYRVFGLFELCLKVASHPIGDGDASPLVVDVGIGQGAAYLDLVTHRRVVDAITEHGAID